MKLLLGIYQDRDEIEKELSAQGLKGREGFQVGPFASHSQALEWMNYMEMRMYPKPVERLIVGHLYPNTWYGTALALE